MKTAIKRENDECLVMILKHVNRLGIPKLWAIAHENAIKRENDDFLVITLKHVSDFTVILNSHGTPILWAITHENGHKTRK